MCKLVAVPIYPNPKLNEDPDNQLIDVGRYQHLVGQLIYLSLTKPDIAYAISVVSHFIHALTLSHMEATYQILRYFKGCPRKGVFYSSHGHHRVEAYIDANWIGSVIDRRSTSSYCTFIGGNLIT